MFFSPPKLGIKCLLSLSKGGLKIVLRDTTWIIFPSQKPLHLDVLWQENLHKKHFGYNVDICNKKGGKINVDYIIKNSPRIFTTASS